MTQPTWDEMRARVHADWSKRYAAEPGTGPVGMTCHDCTHLRHTGQANPSKYPKCGLTRYTHGDATTIKTRTPACSKFASWRAGGATP